MDNFILLLKNNLLEFKRTKKWWIYLLTFSLVTIFSVISARVLPELLNVVLSESGLGEMFAYEVSVADSYVQLIANFGEIIWLLIAIMFSSVLVKEKNSGTYYMLKSNGVNEKSIVLAHFVSKMILITISYLLSLVIFVPLNLELFKQYTGVRGVVSLSFLYMILVFALSLALFISSLVNSKSKGYIVMIGVYFALTLLAIFPYIDIYNPMYGLTLASEVIVNDDIKISDYVVNGSIILIASIGCLLASIYCFKNKIDNRK